MSRRPVVAGQFYEGTADALRKQVEQYLDPSAKKEKALGVVSPHAGFMYSGPVAGAVLGRVELTDTVVILTPTHRPGARGPFGLWRKGGWQTPLGEAPTDEELAGKLESEIEMLQEDESAHLYEHSGEVQVPFLQVLKPDVKIVCVAIATNNLNALKAFGSELGKCLKESSPPPLIVASSDMTHYESAAQAKTKDQMAIEEILQLDEDALWLKVTSTPISMCGVAPTVSMLSACKELGATKAELVKYATSGDVTGDYSAVVGYAGIIVK